ncbi:MAG: CARDB domain-containing protein [Ferruginibacter sp.]
MKKILLLLLISLITVTVAGQQSESEPNNTFATADLFDFNDIFTASVGNGDGIDYHRLNYLSSRNFYLLLEATNISGGDAFLKFDMYDGREGAGLIHTRNISNNLNIPDGATVYDTIYLCSQSVDNYFIAFTTNGEFDYQIQWFPVLSYLPENEPNNTSNNANPFAIHTTKEGSLQYTFRGNPTFDLIDWYQSGVLPAGNYNDIKLYLTGVNTNCTAAGTRNISYMVFKSPDLVTPFAQGFIGNTNNVAQYETVVSAIPLSNMQQGDIFYVRLTSNAPFGYTLRYTDLAPFFDPEDNCCIYNAIHLRPDSTVGGNVGDYDYVNDVYIDEFDTYRIILPHAGTVKIFGIAEMFNCGNIDNPALSYEVLDKYGNNLPGGYGNIASWIGDPPCGDLIRDTIKIRAFQADTFFLRLNAYRDFGDYPIINYNLKYQLIDSVGSDVEPNNDTASAILIDTGQVKKGIVGFKRNYYEQDIFDYYKINIPAEAKATIYLKSTYRGETRTNNSNAYRLGINYINNNYTYYSPSQVYRPTLYADSVIYDTIQICPVMPGTAYFRLTGDLFYAPYEYEFSIRYTDTSSWVNDIEPNGNLAQSIPIATNTEKTGRLNYYTDRIGVTLDHYDYYRADMPYDGTIKVYVEAMNMTCANSNGPLVFYLNDPGQHNLITRNIGNLTSVPPGITVYDTITLCSRGDTTMYFLLHSLQLFRYKLRYEITDTSENDIEPNGTFTQAGLIRGSQTKKGHIGYIYNYSSNTYDGYDYYKIAVGDNDSLKLIVQGTNMSCTSAQELTFSLYRGNHSTILTRNIGNVAAVPIGATVYDTIKIAVVTTDTIFIRINAGTQFKYQFTTNALKPTSRFSITGDTTACLGTYIYTAHNITDTGIVYNWSLPVGGGTISHIDSVATVNWITEGNRTVRLTISNGAGTSLPRNLNVIVNGSFPTQVPVAFNFARTLSTNSLPPGATCQWYKNDTLIVGATDSSYYAAAAGSFTVKFVNDCGSGPASNAIIFPAAALAQTITFPHIPTVTMSPTAKAALQATASSSLPVFYQKISGPGNIINDTLFITGAGTIIVKALQPGDDVYSAAPSVNDTITVIKGNQVIIFDSIPGQIFDANKIILTATSSMGIAVSYSIISGSTYASVSSNQITKKGAGVVTVRASQSGNANYNPATPVDRTFCIGVRTLTPIIGEASPCLATYTYRTQKIPGAIFVWTLSGGGILTTNNDTAWVQWQTPGTHTITVKANSPCDPVYTNTQSLTISTSNNVPGAVSTMLPANNSVDQQLPLTLSWIPGNNTVNYDLYLWDSTATEPVIPYVSNINDIQYIIPKNPGLPYNRTYKWKIVAKNPCGLTAGPIQQFRLIPLPDLVVSDVQAPATANSGQTITISWKVTNIGPGKTLPGVTWSDGVYFALDTLPNVDFRFSPAWDPNSWSSLTANGRPLLLGKKVRPAALDSGQFYTNTINFTLPLSYNFPVYVYVIADNNFAQYAILQVSRANDTARKQDPIMISLSPTPDFRVDSVFAPASTFSGSTVNLTYKVKNYGVVTPAGSNWTDSVFMSQNPLFNRNDAILINVPKWNDSYYPNASRATAYNNTQLLPDSFYTRNLQVVIPNYIFGTWFIYVKANANTANNAFVYEGALNNNNFNKAQVQVYLTPTPKLTVSTLTLPVTTVSTTQSVGANWNIKNEGFRDNIEKNKGHIITMSSCPVTCGPGAPPNSVCTAPSVIRDSLVFGSSYWIDRVYLSTDSSGLNIGNATLVKETTHGTQNSGLYTERNPSFVSCPAAANGNINVTNVINPGTDFAKAENFTIPSNLQPGNYYVYVYTNPTKTVFEYPGTPQIKRSTLPIIVNRPDAVVPSVSVPANSIGGTTIVVNYQVLNNGPGAVFNHIRRDRLYISNFSNFDASAQLVGTQTFTEDLPVGTNVPHTFTYTFSPVTTGAKYFYVQTNYDSSFRETNSANNISASAGTLVSAAIASDLVVSSVIPADSVFTIYSSKIKYTVTNNGIGTTAGTWRDSLFISCSPTFNPATSYYIGKLDQARAITTGGNYTDSINLNLLFAYNINNCFPQQMYSSAYFYVKTNANNGTYEGSNINNNVGSSGNKVLVNPLVDHIVTTVAAPDTTTVGFAYPVNWRIKNIGYNPGWQYYYNYNDAIYFSTDSIADANDVKAGQYLKYLALNRNQDSLDSKSPYTPVLLTGDYYVYVKTNTSNSIPAEKILSNNVNFLRNASGFAKKIHVIRPALADLTDSIIAAPVSVATGQPITIIYKITNSGTGLTYPGTTWQNQLWLSDDFAAHPNSGDRLLATRTRTSALPAGNFYYDTVTVTIPNSTIPGNYVLIIEANSNNVVVESNINNNLGFSLITVFTPPLADLTVTNVLKPDTVYLGYTMDTAKWVITNASAEQARGYTSDGIYLSAGNLFDSTAVLIGIKNKNINMAPLQSDTVRMAPLVTGVVEGNYNLFVKTDLLNQISELDKTNNTGNSATPVYVKVKELLLNVPESATLQTLSRYYKLKIPDSLRGSTILVTLKTNDSLTMRNEMFIGGGYVPTAAHYNYRFEIPNYGNQQIVMTSVTDSVYYILARCVSPNPLLQNITLKAVKLPFAILNVHTNSGGNIGNVTVRIKGSLFRDSMVAILSKPGTTIYASAVYFTNSTQVFATFNLQGKPLGIYDVTLMKPDSSTAILPNGFSVVVANNGGIISGGGPNTGAGNGNAPGCDPGAASGLNSQLVVELVVPARVLINRPVVIQIHYNNPTNFDIPAQSRTLYSEAGMKMAFTKEGVPTGTTSLYLELTEPGGPPGIIRAGGSGTITVHTVAPSRPPVPDNSVLFKLQ